MTKPQSLLRAGMLPIGILLIVFVFVTQQVMAAAPTVSFPAAVNISNTSERSRWPSVAFDSEGKAHIAWLQQADVNETGRIMYTNNRGGTFRRPVQIAPGEGSVDHSVAIAIAGGLVHVIASTEGNKISAIRFGIDDVANRTTQLLDNGKATATAATVDTAGVVHAAWISNNAGQYQVYHSRFINGNWVGRTAIKSGSRLQKFPSLVATKDGHVHAGFRIGDPVGNFEYLEWDGREWQDRDNPPAGGNNDQVYLGSDGTNLYGIWEDSDSHTLSYARRINGDWTGADGVPGQKRYNNQPTIFGSPAGGGRAYAVWSRGSASGERDEVVLAEVTANGDWSDVVRLGAGAPEGSRGASCGAQIGVVWHDKPSGDIFFAGSTSSAGSSVAQIGGFRVYLPLVSTFPTPPPVSC